MTAIKLNSIEGLMVENRKHDEIPPPVGKGSWDNVIGYNKAITEQGSREITMDREKLAMEIHQCLYSKPMTENMPVRALQIYGLADAIIANQSQIIKAVV